MAKPAQAERSHCPATRPRVSAAFDNAPYGAPRSRHGCRRPPRRGPQHSRRPRREGGPCGPNRPDPAGRSRRQASAGRAGGAESPPAPAIGITRPIKRGRAAASRAAHGGEGGAERKRSEWGRGGEVCGGNYLRHCQGPRQGRRGHMKQPPEVFQRSQARQGRDPYMCIER